jgi:crossover junction endodeoxyribonuclease RuvC
MRILGIDPGLQVCGYAVLDKNSSAEKLLEAGLVRTDSSAPIEMRLSQIAKDFRALIKKFRPGLVAVEELYSHYAHPRTAILMGHARGVILQTASAAQIEVRSFSATRIKKAITGNGRASKMQIQKAIMSLLGLRKLPEPADVADAIAAALCCANEL